MEGKEEAGMEKGKNKQKWAPEGGTGTISGLCYLTIFPRASRRLCCILPKTWKQTKVYHFNQRNKNLSHRNFRMPSLDSITPIPWPWEAGFTKDLISSTPRRQEIHCTETVSHLLNAGTVRKQSRLKSQSQRRRVRILT